MNLRFYIEEVSANLFHLKTESKMSLGLYTDIEEYRNDEIVSHMHFTLENGEKKKLWYVGNNTKVVRVNYFIRNSKIVLN